MKKSTFSLSVLSTFASLTLLLSACQEDEITTQVTSPTTTAELLSSEEKVGYLVENFDRQLPAPEIDQLVDAYRTMSVKETEQFIRMSYEKELREGADKQEAVLLKDFQLAVNQALYREHQQTLAGASGEILKKVAGQVGQQEKYQRLSQPTDGDAAARTAATCGSSFWYPQGNNTPVGPEGGPGAGQYEWNMYHQNETRTFCSGPGECVGNCLLLFFSAHYNSAFYGAYVYGSTSRAQVAMAGGLGSFSSKEVLVREGVAQFQMVASAVQLNTPLTALFQYRDFNNFASELKVILQARP